jgi:hypothetical protein
MAIVKKMENKQEEVKPKYVPGKSYKWHETSEFTFVGPEFGTLYNGLFKYVNTEEFQKRLQEAERTLALFETYKLLQNTFVNGVESGVIEEMSQDAAGEIEVVEEEQGSN